LTLSVFLSVSDFLLVFSYVTSIVDNSTGVPTADSAWTAPRVSCAPPPAFPAVDRAVPAARRFPLSGPPPGHIETCLVSGMAKVRHLLETAIPMLEGVSCYN